jgi:hypothetical protein
LVYSNTPSNQNIRFKADFPDLYRELLDLIKRLIKKDNPMYITIFVCIDFLNVDNVKGWFSKHT